MFFRWNALLFFLAHCAFSQTGNFKKADSLKKLLSSKKGIEVIAIKTSLAETLLDSVPEESLKLAQEVLKDSEKDAEQTALANYVAGKAYNRLNKNDSAIIYLQKGLPWFEKNPENKRLAKTYYSLGLIFSQMSLFSEAYGSMEKAIKIYEKEKDTGSLGKAWNVVGIIYKERKEYQKALEYYKNALTCLNDPANEKVKALVYNNMGVVYQRLEKSDEAEEYFKKSLEIAKRNNDTNSLGNLYVNLGVGNRMKKNYEKALEYYAMGLEMKERSNDELGIAKCLLNIANIYSEKKEYKRSLTFHYRALEKLEKLKTLVTLDHLYTGMHEDYEKLGQKDSALKYYKLYNIVHDTLFKQEHAKRFTEAELKMKYDKQKAIDDLKLEQQNEKQKIINYSAIAALLIAALIIFIVYRSYLQKKKANVLLKEQKDEIESQKNLVQKKNNQITESIDYARHIQESVVRDNGILNEIFPEHFILNKPKDIVSGDFFWAAKSGIYFYFALADSTGHGVPGAFMSIMGYNLLDRVFITGKTEIPSEILNKLNKELNKSLKPLNGENTRDGMDLVLCRYDTETKELIFSAAKNKMYLVRNNALTEFSGDRIFLGNQPEKKFSDKKMNLEKGDTVFLFTDGYPDQKGGAQGKKYFYAPFSQLLLQPCKDLSEKKQQLESTMQNWMTGYEQTDDMMIVGLKV